MVYNIKLDSKYGTTVGAIRDGMWKYIQSAKSATEFKEELYNLEEDFTESNNLADTEADMTTYMKGLFEEISLSMVPADEPPRINAYMHVDVDENGYIRSGWCEV